MSAFDEARARGVRGKALTTSSAVPVPRQASVSGGGFGSSAFDAAAAGTGSSRPSGSYQNADRLYTSTCDNVEKQLRLLASYCSAAKKQVELIGGARDSQDLRTKVKAGVVKGTESIKILGTMLKVELAPAVDSADLSAREKTARKQQMQRYMSDFKSSAEAFEDIMKAAQAAERKFPNAPKAAAEGEGAGRRGKGKVDDEASREEERLLSRMQAVDFDASLVEERESAIINIASTIQEVNETMKDLAALVEEQGRDIEVIESNVDEAESRTASGVKELETASKFQKGYRKWIFIFIAIILAVAGGATAYVFLSKKN